MIQIFKFTNSDDMLSTTHVDVMVCSSKDGAREIILNEINKDFEGNWKNLREAAMELNNDLGDCFFDEDTFTWHDNGKGETYLISRINEKEVNTKFQNVGVI
jgi:hypothetical protein